MLENEYTFPFNAEDSYDLTLPICDTWKQSKRRVLVILQTVDGRDLKIGKLLGDPAVKRAFTNVINYSRTIARTYESGLGSNAYAVCNFNAKRHLHLSATARLSIEKEFATRVRKIIAKLKPTHILVSGDTAMARLFPDIIESNYKNGWVHKDLDGMSALVTSTLDFSRLLEKFGALANLLGYFCRHLANLLIGYHPHSLAHLTIEPRYIDTIEKFDKLYERLLRNDIIAVDTETKDLSVLHNAIYTIQFATPDNPNVGYVLPLKHPMTPWKKEDLRYILTKLRSFFRRKEKDRSKQKELVFVNGMYDLRVIRRQLKIAIIWHKVWEVTSGEHDLDENIKSLSSLQIHPGGLAAIFCSYGNDFYYREDTSFSKKDRNTTGSIRPDNPGFLKYAAADVVSILNIRAAQIEMSKHQTIDGKTYKPYFVRHMLHQMSDTAHQLSHLREDGSLIDAKYLKFLTSRESPIRHEMKVLSDSLIAYPEAQQANDIILADNGFKSKGLFGAKAKPWALSFSKPNHLRTLFLDVMKLDHIDTTASGAPSVDKAFVEEYKDRNPIVSEYGEWTKLAKLLSTYAKGWYKQLISNNDSITDSHLRPDYSSFDVATGRLASKNPSLQTIPSRGKLVKIIKKMFVAKKGTILIRYDYSAHEVRVWSIVSGDKLLAAVFKVGQELRQMFIQNPTEENKKAIKLKGDIHILNVKRLLGKDVDKDHPLRDAIKAIIFGLLYGKSPETLGVDTKLGDIMSLKDQIRTLNARIAELEKS